MKSVVRSIAASTCASPSTSRRVRRPAPSRRKARRTRLNSSARSTLAMWRACSMHVAAARPGPRRRSPAAPPAAWRGRRRRRRQHRHRAARRAGRAGRGRRAPRSTRRSPRAASRRSIARSRSRSCGRRLGREPALERGVGAPPRRPGRARSPPARSTARAGRTSVAVQPEHEALDPLGRAQGERLADRAAEREADERDPLEPELVEQREHVARRGRRPCTGRAAPASRRGRGGRSAAPGTRP